MAHVKIYGIGTNVNKRKIGFNDEFQIEDADARKLVGKEKELYRSRLKDDTAEIPETIMLNKASKITDTNVFISTNIPRIKAWGSELDKCPSYWHLMELVKVLENRS